MGGESSCNNRYLSDWYGKFSVSWTGNWSPNPKRRLKDWLDPAGTNVQTLDGIGYCQESIMPIVETYNGGRPSSWCTDRTGNQINLKFGTTSPDYPQTPFDVRIVRVGGPAATDLGTAYGNTLTAVNLPRTLQIG